MKNQEKGKNEKRRAGSDEEDSSEKEAVKNKEDDGKRVRLNLKAGI